MKPSSILLAFFGLTLPFTNLVRADIIFTPGNNPQPNEENVLLNNGTTGMTVFGVTNQTLLPVSFSSTQLLTEPLLGQARIEATNGTSQVPLTNISFGLTNDGTFLDAIFNMYLSEGSDTANITAVANDGTFSFALGLGNGQNFLTIVATNGEVLQSISISTQSGFTDLRNIAISGATGGTNGVPESGATLPLLAATMIAAAFATFAWPPRMDANRSR